MALMHDPSVLVLRALGLGDFLTAVPALRAVSRAMPEHALVLACPPELEPLAALSGCVDRVLPQRGLGPLGWEGPSPSVAVNLHGRGPQSHRLLQALTPGRLVGFACSEAGAPGPPWDEDEHEVARWCRLVESVGWPADPSDLLLGRPERPPAVESAVVVHPGAAYPARRWPADRFAQVARWLDRLGYTVVVTGGTGEQNLAAEVAAAAGLHRRCVLAGELDLGGLAALVAAARLVICGDTGVAHLASAYAVPSVVLFGPVAPSRWGPPPHPRHTVMWRGSGDGDAWGSVPDAALLRITVDDVRQAVGPHLAGTWQTPSAPRSESESSVP